MCGDGVVSVNLAACCQGEIGPHHGCSWLYDVIQYVKSRWFVMQWGKFHVILDGSTRKKSVEHKNNCCIHLTYYCLLRHAVAAMLLLLFIIASY